MDKEIWKERSGEARLKRKMILNEKRPDRFRISPESEKMPHHTNDENHLSRPAMYTETGRPSMSGPLSFNSKEQETSLINRKIAIFGQSLISGRRIIGENHHVSPGEPAIRSTSTTLEEVEGKGACSTITMKRPSSPNSTSKDLLANPIPNLPTNHIPIEIPSTDINSSDVLIRRAAMYQDYMQQIPIPSDRRSVIPFTSWMGLGKSIKKLYGQPLHYLTNIRLKQWDQMRIGSEDQFKRLDDMIHPVKAETTIWLMEEVHRQSISHLHLADLWEKDPMHNGFIDSIFPTLQGKS